MREPLWKFRFQERSSRTQLDTQNISLDVHKELFTHMTPPPGCSVPGEIFSTHDFSHGEECVSEC